MITFFFVMDFDGNRTPTLTGTHAHKSNYFKLYKFTLSITIMQLDFRIAVTFYHCSFLAFGTTLVD